MKTIKFTTCEGDKIINPDFDKLKFLIRTGGSEYWEGGSGQALLEYNDEQKTSELYLMMSEQYGFYLEYCNDNAYVPMTNDSFEDIIQIYVGGDPIPVPRALFLNVEETEKQVEEFLNTGGINHSIKWVEKHKTGWNYGEDTSAKEYIEPVPKDIREYIIKNAKVKRKWMKEYEAKND